MFTVISIVNALLFGQYSKIIISVEVVLNLVNAT